MTTLLEHTPDMSLATNSLTTQRIVLIGFMGAGKSTIGRLLAMQLGWHFIDTDLHIEGQSGCTVAEIFNNEGEPVFRKRESAALTRALGQRQVVIAVGGGAPEVLTNRLLLEQTPATAVVFLDAPFEVLFDRCVLQEGAAVRPVLLDVNGAADRFRNRRPHYLRCAQVHILAEGQHPQQTAASVMAALLKEERPKA